MNVKCVQRIKEEEEINRSNHWRCGCSSPNQHQSFARRCLWSITRHFVLSLSLFLSPLTLLLSTWCAGFRVLEFPYTYTHTLIYIYLNNTEKWRVQKVVSIPESHAVTLDFPIVQNCKYHHWVTFWPDSYFLSLHLPLLLCNTKVSRSNLVCQSEFLSPLFASFSFFPFSLSFSLFFAHFYCSVLSSSTLTHHQSFSFCTPYILFHPYY